jgi:hypothetical protein
MMGWFLVSLETKESNHCDMMVPSFKAKGKKRWCLKDLHEEEFSHHHHHHHQLCPTYSLSACAFLPQQRE